MRKDDSRIEQANAPIAKLSTDDQVQLMDQMIKNQPVDTDTDDAEDTFFNKVLKIWKENWPQFLRGAGLTLLISLQGRSLVSSMVC